ncbi:Glycosyltransferase subfamily 4-like, N-terminal domain protein [Acididesulfobacillus acetoxydans]|uniref:Glycosyl transferase group 1 n=1 Tax=Acididesulfobacillus acetoxydans TaxID=1561005 RepID=A0A8S0XUQ0_9FIRM|nr:glycosyltransferase family 4 protein [Acididesulfobacillus acetoxydans]CAA7599627.1 Glycosyltransferase subfamily 4-like, N-terminal domain protein [Acididesulfobacillus acetoxydans]CEJ06462.1 Glycosyl transferase group 1 [Acididesulfobacillus acetoxydans]
MRLCFLGDAGSIHLQRWLTYFVSLGHEVHVVSFRDCPVEGVQVHLLASGREGRLAYVKALTKVRGIVRRINPDILHAHYATSFGLLGIMSQFHPLVVSAWGSDVLVAPVRSYWLRKVVECVLPRADALTSDSLYMSGRMEELLHRVPKRLLTVTMGVSQAWFDGITPADKKPAQILSLRGHQPIYNIDIILKAIPETVRAVPKARLVLAGEGEETPKLKALAASLGIEPFVRFVGQLPHSEVEAYLNESAVMVSVPSSDATAVSLLEAMACGSFPVLSDLPANREWVSDGINGLIVPAKDAAALAGALIRGLRDQGLRERAFERNRKKIRERAIWEDNMAEVQSLYGDLLRLNFNKGGSGA